MTCPLCDGGLADGEAGRICPPCDIVLPPTSAVARELLQAAADMAEGRRLLGAAASALAGAGRWDELEALLLDLSFLEAKVRAGLAFQLAADFALALERLPEERPWRRPLGLLQEAYVRDLHFIARQPASLFQCLWNSCWWHDCPEAAGRWLPPREGWPAEGAPWELAGPKLSPLLESWRREKEAADPGFNWLRALRPHGVPLGGPQRAVIPADWGGLRLLNLQFSPDGGRLFVWLNPIGPIDEGRLQLRAWDAATGQEAEFEQWEVPPPGPCITPDGRWRVECGGAGGGWGMPVRLVDVATGREVASFPTGEDVNIQRVAFSPGGERIIGGGWGIECNGEVLVWNVATGARLAWFQPSHLVFTVAVSFNRQVAATGGSGGEVLLWALDTGEHTATLVGHQDSVEALAFSRDGCRLASTSGDGSVRVWGLSGAGPLPRLRDHPHGAELVEFSEDGSRLLTSSADETAWLWDAQSGAPVACLLAHAAQYLEGGPPFPFASIRAGRVPCLLRGEVWDAATGATARPPGVQLWGGPGGRQVVWSPDGASVARYGHRLQATVSSTTDLSARPRLLRGHTGDITSAAFSPDSRFLVTASFDRTVRVWDAASGKEVVCLRGHDNAVSCVAFSPDGRLVASGAADRTVRVWDWQAGKETACVVITEPGGWCRISPREGPSEHLHAVRAVAFTHDGRRLVTDCGRDFRLWDIEFGALGRTFQGSGSLEALAAGLPWQAFIRGDEMVVERHDSGAEVARVPVLSRCSPVAHPGGRIWAVGGRWLCHFVLEGR